MIWAMAMFRHSMNIPALLPGTWMKWPITESLLPMLTPARPLVRLPAMGLSPEDITGVRALKAVYYMDIHAPLSLLREAQWPLC